MTDTVCGFFEKIRAKLFGGIDLTWPKLTVFAVIAGVYTGVMALIPALYYTSFNAITVSFEAWILFGIVIIMNPFESTHVMLQFLGIALIAQAVLDIVALVQVFLVAKVIEQAVEEVKNEVDSAAAAVVADANMAFHQADEELLKAEAAEIFNETPPVVDVEAEPAESAE